MYEEEPVEEEEIEDFYENDLKELSLPPVHAAPPSQFSGLPPVKLGVNRPSPLHNGANSTFLPNA